MLLAAREMLAFCQSRSTCNPFSGNARAKAKNMDDFNQSLKQWTTTLQSQVSDANKARWSRLGEEIYQQHMRNEAAKIRSKAPGD